MVRLRAYFDDSGEELDPQHKASALFGYCASSAEWSLFEARWQAALSDFDMPYFHMKEFAHSIGPFSRFRRDEPARRRFIQALSNTISSIPLRGIGSIVRLSDLRSFNKDHGLSISDYALNLYACVVILALAYDGAAVEVELDRASQRKMGKEIEIAQSYINTDPIHKGRADKISIVSLAKSITFRDVLPIQAADFIAWEARKDITDMEDWLSVYQGPKDTKEALENRRAWAAANKRNFPYNRKSLELLTREAPHGAPLWDYVYLERLHAARNGNWPKSPQPPM